MMVDGTKAGSGATKSMSTSGVFVGPSNGTSHVDLVIEIGVINMKLKRRYADNRAVCFVKLLDLELIPANEHHVVVELIP